MRKFFILIFLISFLSLKSDSWASCCWPRPTWPEIPNDFPWPTEATPTPPPIIPSPTPTSIVQPTSMPTPGPTLLPTSSILPTATPTSEPSEGGGVGGVSGQAGEYVCSATTPSAPILLSVVSLGPREVKLSWGKINLATHYSISYGPSSRKYLWGVNNTGNTTFFNVGGLDPNANYCFAVRAANDCAPSNLSNEICPGKVLGVSVLGATGTFHDEFFQILFIIGCVCFSTGLRLFLPCLPAGRAAKRLA